jgi:predicted PurR-regulated permease PerM
MFADRRALAKRRPGAALRSSVLSLFRRGEQPSAAAREGSSIALEPRHFARLFRPPAWLRDIGFASWFLVGFLALTVGVVWILGITSTIVDPVAVGAVIAVVAAPLVSSMQRHRVPRAAGAAIVLVGLVVVMVVVFVLVIAGIRDHSGQITSTLSAGVDKVQKWFADAGANNTSDTRQNIVHAVSRSQSTVLEGLAAGIRNIASIVFFITFTAFSIFFLLKDGAGIRRFVDRHLGLPTELAVVITTNVMHAMRRYFLGVTAVAAFNGVVVGIGALILGVPLAGTIALVTFVTAYIPYIGAFVSGAFAVLLALGSKGTTTALVMLVIVILANGFLQNLFQPLAYGAALDLNPLAVLIVTIASGALFGMIGMIVAAPLLSAATHTAQQIAEARAREQAEAEVTAGGGSQPSGP